MKTVLVTGATRGLGLAIVHRLASDDYKLIATGRRITPDLQALIDSAENKISFAELDLSNSDAIHPFVRNTTKTHGPLFGLINNAAVGHEGILATMHESEISELIRVNLFGPILLAKYAVRSMLSSVPSPSGKGQGEGGRIINIASIIAQTGFTGLSVYAATKAGLVGFTKSLAREVGKAGVTVNSISPGFMETEMTQDIDSDKLESIRRRSPLGRLATVADIAHTVAFLLSDRASSITGTNLTIDAGSTA